MLWEDLNNQNRSENDEKCKFYAHNRGNWKTWENSQEVESVIWFNKFRRFYHGEEFCPFSLGGDDLKRYFIQR